MPRHHQGIKKSKQTPFGSSGFTLVEILVVVAIVAVLSTISTVAVGSARSKARNSVRRHDTAIIRDAIIRYQHDNNGLLPGVIDETVRMIGTAQSGCDSCGGGGDPPEDPEPVEIQLYPVADTHIQNGPASGSNFGALDYLKERPDGIRNTNRILIRFDLSSIPSGSTFDYARLYLHQKYTNGWARDVTLSAISENWDEMTVTWDNQPAIDLDITDVQSVAFETPWVYDWESWNALIDVYAIVNESMNNYGWMLKDSLEDGSQRYWDFWSREGSQNQPYLDIRYTPPSESGGGPGSDSCLDLSSMVDGQLSKMPTDPKSGTLATTKYTVNQDAQGIITVSACAAENGEVIISQGSY